jgi:putative membrane protein
MSQPIAWLLAVFAVLSAASAAEPPGVASTSQSTSQTISTPAFLTVAVANHKFEIASSQLALRKTQSSVVHGFAHQMILDYQVAAMKLKQAVADAKLPAPREALDAGHKALLDELTRTPPGKTLSKAYLEAQEKVLREDLPVFEAYAKSGDNERLKVFAEEMVPVLRGHLEQLAKVRK